MSGEHSIKRRSQQLSLLQQGKHPATTLETGHDDPGPSRQDLKLHCWGKCVPHKLTPSPLDSFVGLSSTRTLLGHFSGNSACCCSLEAIVSRYAEESFQDLLHGGIPRDLARLLVAHTCQLDIELELLSAIWSLCCKSALALRAMVMYDTADGLAC